MAGLKEKMSHRVLSMGAAARLWWVGVATVGLAAFLVLAATAMSDASSHSATAATAASRPASSSSAGGSGAMAGMTRGRSNSTSSARATGGAAQTTSSICSSVKGTTTMSNGMVMAPVPSGPPTASQQAAADRLVAQTKATLAKYATLSAATAAGYVPATNPAGHVVHYANWGIAKNDGFDPTNPAFLVYANTFNGPELLGAMYLGPAPCTPGPDVGGSLTQWHAHDNLCLAGGRVVGQTSATGSCATGVHNSNTYFMLHVWVEPSLAATHQFQADLTRSELVPIITGQA
jgi:hypothetical protein